MHPIQLQCVVLLFQIGYRGPIPVIGYHEFGGPPEYTGGPKYDVHGLNIPISAFRSQLEQMYSEGFRPVNMRDVIQRHLKLPPGKRPIVLTFDDGRPTQFRYLANGKIDPDCAVGVMVSFHRLHPDWPLRGSFYLIAGSDQNGVPFDQEGLEKQKMRELLAWGFEIGNHSLTHPSFRDLTAKQIVKEVSGGAAYLKRLIPGIKVDTLALPYGELPKSPKNWPLLRSGPGYRNVGVLLFSDGLCPSPYTRKFDPFEIPRIPPKPGYVEQVLRGLSSKKADQ